MESRRVEEASLKIVGQMGAVAREGFFDRLLRPSTQAAFDKGESLALVRPTQLQFRWKKKSANELSADAARRKAAMAQRDMFDSELAKLPICPYALRLQYTDGSGAHGGMCGDWETTWTFMKWRTDYGEEKALQHLKRKYEQEYMDTGVALSLGTVHKRPRQWLLLGVVRLNETQQPLLI